MTKWKKYALTTLAAGMLLLPGQSSVAAEMVAQEESTTVPMALGNGGQHEEKDSNEISQLDISKQYEEGVLAAGTRGKITWKVDVDGKLTVSGDAEEEFIVSWPF